MLSAGVRYAGATQEMLHATQCLILALPAPCMQRLHALISAWTQTAKRRVPDTPGLLNRPDAERNTMQHLTLACLQHLWSVCIR